MQTSGKKRLVWQFLRRHKLGVLATRGRQGPEAAIVDFSETAKLEILVTTMAQYRKYKNLLASPRVAFVVGGEENITLQYEGVAQELTPQAFKKYAAWHLKKNPVEAKFAAMPAARFFRLRPVWARYSDFTRKPNQIFEIKF